MFSKVTTQIDSSYSPIANTHGHGMEWNGIWKNETCAC